MDKKKKILAGVGAVAALITVYIIYQSVMYVTTDNAQVDAHAVMLAPKVGGYITEVNVEEGQRVKKNDILAQIDDRDYQNSVKQFQAELSSIEARRKDSETNYKRIAELYSKEAVSHQQYDTTVANYSEIKAKYDSLSAQLAQAQLNLENTKIKAPSDGFIAKKSVNVGQFAAPGVPLFGFVDAQERWITANFKETELDGIQVGKAVDVSVDAITSKSFRGTVTNIMAATGATFTLLPPDNATGNFTKVVQRIPVKIKLEGLTDKDIEELRDGLSADVKVHKH